VKKSGKEYRGAATGSTRWEVERNTPLLHTSSRSPMLTTNAPGTGGASTHWPAPFITCNPGAVACRIVRHS
jgi:hypothetical protein